jgi:hypothetical protein
MPSERNNASGGEGHLNLGQNLWRAALVSIEVNRTARTLLELLYEDIALHFHDCRHCLC